MKIAIFNNNQLGIVKEEKVYDVSEIVNWKSEDTGTSFLYLIEHFDHLKDKIEESYIHCKSF